MSRCRQSFDPEGFERFCQQYPLSDDPEYNAQVEANEPIVSLLTEIRDLMIRHNETAEEKAQKRREKDKIRKAKKRALSAMSARTKEGKGKKETFPPAPPIEKKGESPEKTATIMRTCARVCACAREGLTPEREIALAAETASLFERVSPPCRFEVLAWAHRVWRRTSQDDLINVIFDELRQNGWTDPLTGKRIGNWASYIRACLRHKLPPREVAKATLFKKPAPNDVLRVSKEELDEIWNPNDGQE